MAESGRQVSSLTHSTEVGILNVIFLFLVTATCGVRDKWVPVTTAWRVLRLQMEEQPPVWRAAANILNKQSRTVDKGWSWSSSLGVGQGANNSSP